MSTITLKENARKAALASVRKRKEDTRLALKYLALTPQIQMIEKIASERRLSGRALLAILLEKMLSQKT